MGSENYSKLFRFFLILPFLIWDKSKRSPERSKDRPHFFFQSSKIWLGHSECNFIKVFILFLIKFDLYSHKSKGTGSHGP